MHFRLALIDIDEPGYDFPEGAVRFAQLEEVITICRLMWTEAEPSFEGTHFRIARADSAGRRT